MGYRGRLFTISFTVSLLAQLVSRYNDYVFNTIYNVMHSFVNESFEFQLDSPVSDSDFAMIWGTLNAIVYGGNILGMLMASRICDRHGRLRGLSISCAVITLGTIFILIAKPLLTFEVIYVGKFTQGFGEAICTLAQGLYVSEIAPVEYRAILFATRTSITASVEAIALGLGTVLGTAEWWPLLVGLPIISAILLTSLTFAVPDSALYLTVSGATSTRVERSIRFFNSPSTVDEIGVNLTTLAESPHAETLSVRDLLNPVHWKPLIVCISTILVSDSLGPAVLFVYSTTIFQKIGISIPTSIFATSVIGYAILAASVVWIFVINRLPRRRMFLGIVYLQIISTACIIISSWISISMDSTVARVICMICLGFAMFMGMLSMQLGYLVVMELTDQKSRALFGSISLACGMIYSMLVVMFIMPVMFATSVPIAFIPMLIICFPFLIVMMKWLPEIQNTKNLTAERTRLLTATSIALSQYSMLASM